MECLYVTYLYIFTYIPYSVQNAKLYGLIETNTNELLTSLYVIMHTVIETHCCVDVQCQF